MSKVRVYEIARDLGVPYRELVQHVSTLGITVRNHMSALDPSDVERIRRAYSKEKTAKVVEERIRPTVVRRRAVAKKSEAPPAEAESTPIKPAATPSVSQPLSSPSPSVREATPVSSPATTQPAAAKATPTKTDTKAAPAVAAKPVRLSPDSATKVAPAPNDPAPDSSQDSQGSSLPPAAVRFAHANLPPGVVARGSTVSPGAAPLSASARSRIVSEHAARRVDVPRRRELGRAALGPLGRSQPNRHHRKKGPGAGPGQRKGGGKQTEITVPSAQKRIIKIEDQVQLQTLAQRMGMKATEVLMKLMQLGMSGVHINSTLDADTAKILVSEFGWDVENIARSEEQIVKEARGEFEDKEEDRVPRAPIITVMGHVDHGKTSLLDKIRSANVVSREAGGITQHIGAYRVDTAKGSIVFLDTPGHEAFTAMRARGAQCTDVVILVVAADDGVMPQTREAIHHAKAAEVPIVVAVNKIDKPGAQPEQIKSALAAEGLQPEDWGGTTIFVECSAINGQGIDTLLDSVLLTAEMLELKANPTTPAEGVILESYLDRGKGPVANVLVRNGTLKIGDYAATGNAWGRIRAMTNDRNAQVQSAGPATPVEVLGLSEAPAAGTSFYVVTKQKHAQEISESRKAASTPSAISTIGAASRSLDQLYQRMQSGEVQELSLIIKADVQGSVEAVKKSLTDLSTEKVRVAVIHSSVGGITENDVMLASASNAIVVGFNVRPAGQAAAAAKRENIEIRLYNIIYEAIDDVKSAMAGLLAPKLVEKELGKAEVRQVFSIPKVGTVAGCYVTDGKILRNAKVRLVRDAVEIWKGDLNSLRRFKDDTREVGLGYECGIGLAGYNDIKERDIIECFETEEVAASLD